MPNLGPTELILILVIVIAVFGAGKLANLGGALGKGVKDFRSAVQDGQDEEGQPTDKGAGMASQAVAAADASAGATSESPGAAAARSETSSEAA